MVKHDVTLLDRYVKMVKWTALCKKTTPSWRPFVAEVIISIEYLSFKFPMPGCHNQIYVPPIGGDVRPF